MKRHIISLIAVILCLSLLCSCSPADIAPEATPEVTETPAPTPAVTPTPELPPKINDGISVNKANANIMAYFELYRLLNPGAYIGCSSWGAYDGYVEVNCYGPDLPAFEASGLLPDCVLLNYRGNQFDPRIDHPIPRDPISEMTFEDGVTLRMERSVYPTFPEYVRYTMESSVEYMYGGVDWVSKYVDGEWHTVPQNNASTALGYSLFPGEPKIFGIQTAQWLGEGLYRISRDHGDHYVEFVVSRDAEPLDPIEENPFRRSYGANFFYRLELPENITNNITGSVDWFTEACTYSVDFSGAPGGEELAGMLLGADFTSDGNTYTAAPLTLSTEDGAALVSSVPSARAILEAYPYCAAEFIPEHYQALGIARDEPYDHTSIRPLREDDLPVMAVDGVEYYVFETFEPVFSSLNYNLKQALDHYRATLSEEEFNEKYGDLTEVRFDKSRPYYKFVTVKLRMSDKSGAPHTTDLEGEAFCGPELHYATVEGEMAALDMHRWPSALTANDDSAKVLTPYEAAAIILPELEKLEQDISIVAAELSYAYHNGDLSTLRPTWIFTAALQTVSPYDDTKTVETYIHIAVDALTGKLPAK